MSLFPYNEEAKKEEQVPTQEESAESKSGSKTGSMERIGKKIVIDDKPRNPNYSSKSIPIVKPEKSASIKLLNPVKSKNKDSFGEYSPPTLEKSEMGKIEILASPEIDASAFLRSVLEVHEISMKEATPICQK